MRQPSPKISRNTTSGSRETKGENKEALLSYIYASHVHKLGQESQEWTNATNLSPLSSPSAHVSDAHRDNEMIRGLSCFSIAN